MTSLRETKDELLNIIDLTPSATPNTLNLTDFLPVKR
jgi:hypothetical protein